MVKEQIDISHILFKLHFLRDRKLLSKFTLNEDVEIGIFGKHVQKSKPGLVNVLGTIVL